MLNSSIVTVKNVKIKRQSEKALFVSYKTEQNGIYVFKDVWVPKSQIYSVVSTSGEYSDIYVTDWIAIRKGFIDHPDQEYNDDYDLLMYGPY